MVESVGHLRDGNRRRPRRAVGQGTWFLEPAYNLSLEGATLRNGKRAISADLQNTRALTYFDSGIVIRR